MKTSKEKIIESGRKLLVEKGYHGASINVIADEVGLKKSSIYSHFSGKDQIVCEALRAAQSDIEKCVVLTNNYQADFLQTLTNIIEFLKRQQKCIGLGILYDHDDSMDELIKAELCVFFEGFKQTLLAPLLQREWQDQLAVENMVEDLISLLEGATVWITLSNNYQPLERVLKFGRFYLELLDGGE